MRDRQPEPPRDLWARTSAAIERESASRRAARDGLRSSRRRSIPLGALSGVAVIAVVIGASVLSGGFINGPSTGVRPAAHLPSRSFRPSPIPGATPIAVGVGSVGWVGTSSDGGLAYNVTDDRRGLSDRPPARLRTRQRPRFEAGRSRHPPKSISQSPVKNQAVVVGTDAAGNDAVRRHVAADAAPDLDTLTDGDADGRR